MLKLFEIDRPVLGLDISDTSLKLIQFRSRKGNLEIQAYADVPIPKEAITAEKIQNPKLVSDVIKRALALPKFGKITTPQVVASVPETKSFVRVIKMPILPESEAKEAVGWEAEAYIPLPLSQVYLDWQILDPSSYALGGGESEGSGKMTVLIAAAPRDYVDDLVAILKGAGLKPAALEVESQATVRSLVARREEAVLIVDIDTVRTSLIIYDRGALQFTSSVPVAGNSFTESIAKALSVDFEKAEKIKRQYGLDENAERGMVKRAMVPILNNLVEEIKNTIRFYEEHAGEGSGISRLLLTGSSSKLQHLPSFLHEKLTHQQEHDHQLRSLSTLKVELGNPWVNLLQKGQVPPFSREDSLSYATAIGLALREADF